MTTKVVPILVLEVGQPVKMMVEYVKSFFEKLWDTSFILGNYIHLKDLILIVVEFLFLIYQFVLFVQAYKLYSNSIHYLSYFI